MPMGELLRTRFVDTTALLQLFTPHLSTAYPRKRAGFEKESKKSKKWLRAVIDENRAQRARRAGCLTAALARRVRLGSLAGLLGLVFHSRRIPDPHRMIPARRSQALAVGTEGDPAD